MKESKLKIAQRILDIYKNDPWYQEFFSKPVKGEYFEKSSKTIVSDEIVMSIALDVEKGQDIDTELMDTFVEMLRSEAISLSCREIANKTDNFKTFAYKDLESKLERDLELYLVTSAECAAGISNLKDFKHGQANPVFKTNYLLDYVGEFGKFNILVNPYLPQHIMLSVPKDFIHYELEVLEAEEVVNFTFKLTVNIADSTVYYITDIPQWGDYIYTETGLEKNSEKTMQ